MTTKTEAQTAGFLVATFWIEERFFVAKGAPLDDGQIRTRDEAAVIVTAKAHRR